MNSINNSLLDFVRKCAQSLEKEGIKYAVSGAIANMAWGVPRTTKDIDIVVNVLKIKLPRLIELFFDLGCEGDLKTAITDAQMKHFFVLKYKPIFVEVFLPVIPYHNKVLERRTPVRILDTDVWFVTAEDLIILKMLFYRTKDIADIKALVATRHDKLDTKYIKDTISTVIPGTDNRIKELENMLKPAFE